MVRTGPAGFRTQRVRYVWAELGKDQEAVDGHGWRGQGSSMSSRNSSCCCSSSSSSSSSNSSSSSSSNDNDNNNNL
jgi:hypothetical protein